ncbi:LuxR family transcriptional regulator [Frankia sp. CcI49]|uniref:response regulator transcription factor n=1 Tax=Frankiaceae TaxID=74712 RepID=UPI0001C44D6C|nr:MULTISPECIES: response regulator transcription factor [Frankiaceae]EFC85408.1 two component transcriptional regulator, LuxR family [Parafrankia sp. EUN1f]KPM54966.1 LuxR family transcriptional regulator [Frankia sp. R43]ONH61172.1 LuxR family transcriptional regulator [Frankia sp. CcI49]
MSTIVPVAAVDDHPIVLRGLADVLAGVEGLELVATATSIRALLAGPGRDAAVVLLDLDLGDGSQAPDNIRRLIQAGTAVIVFSALADPDGVRAAMRAGACGFVTKTDDVEELGTAIRAASEGNGWVSPQLAFMLLTDKAPDRPQLSPQELEALRLYATGMPLKTVARKMDVSPETAKQYIDRVRMKYRRAGRHADTKVDLYRLAVEDGHLDGT